jgi:hypothetical protein
MVLVTLFLGMAMELSSKLAKGIIYWTAISALLPNPLNLRQN